LIGFLTACNGGVGKNRLATASSPYLREHADNPVDWHEWGDEALALAKKENKPLLISIGYASCHWCHEMEKESFMDTAVARMMNENFICVNVDREERPDVDNLYMNACKLISGGEGGWPLNAFALPDGKPFFAGTYYSKSSWKNLLTDISRAFKEKHALVILQADALTKGIADETLSFNEADETIPLASKTNYQKLFDSIYVQLDTANGGLKGDPKFPMPSVMEFLLQHYYHTGEKKALDAVAITLTKMALGGIYDQVGGGFARYSTDREWRLPHFEKMLYDNAQLISLYAHAYQITQNDFYRTILYETISFAENELASPYGGFYSSLNADTENGEGEFYTWGEKEFKTITAGNNLLSEYFNITAGGNWKNGKNILSPSYTPAAFAEQKKLSAVQFTSLLDGAKFKLLLERNKRKKPSTDTKILTAWNAMMLKAYTDAYVATSEQHYLAKAIGLATFLEKTMLSNTGALKRIFTEGEVSVDGFLDDYAWTSYAFIKLYQVSFDRHWLDLSKHVANFVINNFYNKDSHLFNYSSIRDSKLVVNEIEIADEGTPSSNSMMAAVLYSLGVVYDNSDYSELSKGMLQAMAGKMKTYPEYHATWCGLVGLLANGTYEVVVMGKDAIARSKELQKNYLPDCIVMGGEHEEDLPLLENKLRENATLIYVCTNKVCKRPVESVEEALKQIVHNR
jgi:uncharacterized protein YyaL (SSP411 family)